MMQVRSVPRAMPQQRHAAAMVARPRLAVPSRMSVRPRAEVGTGMQPELKEAIDKFISDNKIVVFMKGTRQFPQCGFSNTVVQILERLNAKYETVNILEDDRLRNGMKVYSQWPTFPQVYIDGEFYGGCDIMIQGFQSGELKETLEKVQAS